MIATIVQHDWGSDLGDETKIKTMRRKGISTSISSSSIQSYKLENFYWWKETKWYFPYKNHRKAHTDKYFIW